MNKQDTKMYTNNPIEIETETDTDIETIDYPDTDTIGAVTGANVAGENGPFSLNGDDILRYGEKVARLNRETGTVEFLNDEVTRYRVPVIRMLAEMRINTTNCVLAEEAAAAVRRAGDRSIPPMPKKNPRLGDKTPEVVAWYRTYHPEEYRVRYGLRESMARFPVRDAESGKVIRHRHSDLADRKTHLTERVSDNTSDPSYDWDAE